MAELAFSLRVPADAGYQSIATEVVARFFDLIGGTESDRRTLEAALAKTIEKVVGASASADDATPHVELSCVNGAAGLEVQIRCAGRSAVLRHPSPSAAR